MAQKEVSLIHSFNYEDDEGKQHYFTRDNQDKILEIVGEGNLQPYIDAGVIEVTDEATTAAVEKTMADRRPKGIRPNSVEAAEQRKPAPTTASAAAERRPAPRAGVHKEG